MRLALSVPLIIGTLVCQSTGRPIGFSQARQWKVHPSQPGSGLKVTSTYVFRQMVMHQPHLAVELTLNLRLKLSLSNILLSVPQGRDMMSTGNIQHRLQSISITDGRRMIYLFHGMAT
jgi:hypothetical protein